MSTTHTSTYNTINFADPYKQCLYCNGWITGVLVAPGPLILVPCEHQSHYRDVCPSWGPVDGCTCNPVDHPVPPADVIGDRPS